MDKELEQGIVNRVLFTGSMYVFGTLNSGFFAMNAQGEMIWHIERNNGLNNNTVLY